MTYSKLYPALGIALLGMFSSAHADVLHYSDGHADFAIKYENSAWTVHYRFDPGTILNGEEAGSLATATPDDVRIIVPDDPSTRYEVTGELVSYLSFMSVDEGDSLWLLDWNGIVGQPYFGLGTDDLDYDDFEGGVTFSLNSISGPGKFAMWQYDGGGNPIVGWNATDGLDGNDAMIFSSPTHAHYNWGFTQQGIYTLGVTVTGTHKTDGELSATGNMIFHVGAIPEPGPAVLCGMGLLALLCRGRRSRIQ